MLSREILFLFWLMKLFFKKMVCLAKNSKLCIKNLSHSVFFFLKLLLDTHISFCVLSDVLWLENSTILIDAWLRVKQFFRRFNHLKSNLYVSLISSFSSVVKWRGHFSTSSILFGNGLFKVSGTYRHTKPQMIDIIPYIIAGSQANILLLRSSKKEKKNDISLDV